MSRGAHHRLRIAPEEETDRTEVRAPGAGVQNDGQQASAEAACGLCRAATVEAVQSFAPQQRSLLCPLRENRRPIPTEVPCGHFWRQKVVNLLLAGNAESKVRDTSRSKNRFLLCFWIKPKYQKINRGENICFFMIPDKNRIENRRFSF